MRDRRVYMASAYLVLVILEGLGVAGWLCVIIGCIWPLYRLFGWFKGVWEVAGCLCSLVGGFWLFCRLFGWYLGVWGLAGWS